MTAQQAGIDARTASGVDVVPVVQVGALHLHHAVLDEVPASACVSPQGAGERGPVVSADHHRVAGAAGVDRLVQRVRGNRRPPADVQEPVEDLDRRAREVDERDNGSVTTGMRQPRSQGLTEAERPPWCDDDLHARVRRHEAPRLVRRRTEDDNHTPAATGDQQLHRPIEPWSVVVTHQGLGHTEPGSRAGRQDDPGQFRSAGPGGVTGPKLGHGYCLAMITADDDLRERLTTALAVRRWVDEVAAGAPFHDLDALLVAADTAARTLTPAEVDEALSHHPRIGEKPKGQSQEAAFSRREQAATDADDPAIAAALAQGNQDYEDRFGRIFLIRAAGRTRAEILAELRRRLTLDDGTEILEVADQLRQIALLRLRSLHADPPTPVEER